MALPSASVLLRAAKVSMDEDKPLYFDYYRDSIEKKCCIAVQGQGQEQKRFLAKSNDEYTSTIQKAFQTENCYIIMTENSLYVVDAAIRIRPVAMPSSEESTE